MGAYEDRIRKVIKSRFGSVLKMSEVTGIPKTTIYHALDRGLDNTTTRIRRQIESAVFDIEQNGNELPNMEILLDDERELLACYRMLTTKGKRAVLNGLRDYVEH